MWVKTNSSLPPSIKIANTPNGDVLHSDALSGNQWYNVNGLITGATSQDYTPTSNGDYYVVSTINGCTSDISNSIHFITTGIDPTELYKSIKIYPNPFNNDLVVEFKGNTQKLDFEILNDIGQIVFNGSSIEKTIVQTTNFTPGVYLVKLKSGKKFELRKIVKK